MRLRRASTPSWSTDGGGVTKSSPRMTSYLLPSSGSRWSSSSVHALLGIDIAMGLSSRTGHDACAEDTHGRRTCRHPITALRRERLSLHATLGRAAESRQPHVRFSKGFAVEVYPERVKNLARHATCQAEDILISLIVHDRSRD